MTIGGFIQALKQAKRDAFGHYDNPGELHVYFDFGRLVPTTFASYRGYYDQLALGYRDLDYSTEPIEIDSLINKAEIASESIYTGWKGGEFKMYPSTKLWAANSGDDTGTKVVGVEFIDYEVIVRTYYERY